jgi:membrane protease YdiL (CAAX protease family)
MLAFLALALLFTWPLQLLAQRAPELWLPCMAVAGLGPSLAAIAVTRGAVLRRLRRGAPAAWLLAAFFLPLALLLLAHAVAGELAFAVPFWGAVVWPALGEELGLRGHLQPELGKRWSPRAAPLGVGLAWAVWHLPTALDPLHRLPLFALGLVAWSFVIAGLAQRGAGSVWIGVLAHAGINLAAGLLPEASPGVDAVRLLLLWLAAVIALFSLPQERAA